MIYLNNTIIYLNNLNRYKKYIKIVLNKLFVKDFRCKSEKCEFHKIKIDFLGFFIRIDEIKIDLIKIKVIKE